MSQLLRKLVWVVIGRKKNTLERTRCLSLNAYQGESLRENLNRRPHRQVLEKNLYENVDYCSDV